MKTIFFSDSSSAVLVSSSQAAAFSSRHHCSLELPWLSVKELEINQRKRFSKRGEAVTIPSSCRSRHGAQKHLQTAWARVNSAVVHILPLRVSEDACVCSIWRKLNPVSASFAEEKVKNNYIVFASSLCLLRSLMPSTIHLKYKWFVYDIDNILLQVGTPP